MATTLVSSKISSYGSPYCYYTMTATASRTDSTTATVSITCKSHLKNSDSLLSTGRILNAGVKCGGSWHNKQIKSSTTSWSGTGTHTTSWSFTVTVEPTDTSVVISNVRVLRGDSYSNASQLNSTSVNKTLTIDSAAVATIPTLSTDSLVLGNALTITTSNANTTFTHKLEYKIGTMASEIEIATGVASSYAWTVPISLASYITSDAISDTLNIYCTTYNGDTDTEVGETQSVSLTVTIPDVADTKPTISANIAEGATIPFSNVYVQSLSKLSITPTVTGGAGATVSECTITVEDTDYSATSGTATLTDIINGSGTIPVLISATNSRGFTNTYSTTVSVVTYQAPVISNLVVTQSGQNISVQIVGSASAVSNQNTIGITAKYKGLSETTYQTITLSTFTGYSFDVTGQASTGVSESTPLEVVVTLTDLVYTSTNPITKSLTTNLSVTLAKSQFGYVAIPLNGNAYQMPYDLPVNTWANQVDVSAPSDIDGMLLDESLGCMVTYGGTTLSHSPTNLFGTWVSTNVNESLVGITQAFYKSICLGTSNIYYYDDNLTQQRKALPSGTWNYIVGNERTLYIINATTGAIKYITSLTDSWHEPVYQEAISSTTDLGDGITLASIAPISNAQFFATVDALIGLVLSESQGWCFIKTPTISYR